MSDKSICENEIYSDRVPCREEGAHKSDFSDGGSSTFGVCGSNNKEITGITECSTCRQIIPSKDVNGEDINSHICGLGDNGKGENVLELLENIQCNQAGDDTDPCITHRNCMVHVVAKNRVSSSEESVYSCQSCGGDLPNVKLTVTTNVKENQMFIQKHRRARKLVTISKKRYAERGQSGRRSLDLQRSETWKSKSKKVRDGKEKENFEQKNPKKERMTGKNISIAGHQSNTFISKSKAKSTKALNFATQNELQKCRTKPHHTNKARRCPMCEETFFIREAYLSHLSSHDFSCHHCGKEFKAYENLRHHVLTHSTSEDFICSICGKGFKAKQNLSKHMLIHSTGCALKCEVCGKMFKAKPNLTKHMVIHNDSKSYQCKKCGKYFKASQNLQKHMKVHDKKLM